MKTSTVKTYDNEARRETDDWPEFDAGQIDWPDFAPEVQLPPGWGIDLRVDVFLDVDTCAIPHLVFLNPTETESWRFELDDTVGGLTEDCQLSLRALLTAESVARLIALRVAWLLISGAQLTVNPTDKSDVWQFDLDSPCGYCSQVVVELPWLRDAKRCGKCSAKIPVPGPCPTCNPQATAERAGV